MTVQELIDKLKTIDPNKVVVVLDSYGDFHTPVVLCPDRIRVEITY